MTLGALSALLRVFAGGGESLVARGLQDFGATALALLDIGVLRRTGRIQSAPCDGCDRGFIGRVRFEVGAGWRRDCFCAGWIALAEADVDLIGLDRDRFLDALADAVAGGSRAVQRLAGGRLVRLGWTPAAGRRARSPIFYADGLDDEVVLAAVIEALRERAPSGPGLVLTPSGVALNTPLPSGYRLALLDDVIDVGEQGLVFRDEAAAPLLGRRVKTPGKPGRPSQIETTKQLYLELSRRPDWPAQRSKQANLILEAWPTDERPPPRRETIAGQVSKHSAHWSAHLDEPINE